MNPRTRTIHIHNTRKIYDANYQNLPVNSCMDFDQDSDKVNKRKRINSFLNGRKISGGGVSINSKSVRREELILGCVKNRVIKGANKFDPFHKLLF